MENFISGENSDGKFVIVYLDHVFSIHIDIDWNKEGFPVEIEFHSPNGEKEHFEFDLLEEAKRQFTKLAHRFNFDAMKPTHNT